MAGICFVGTITFQGFENICDIERHLEIGDVKIEFAPCIPAGLHPDASIVIRKVVK